MDKFADASILCTEIWEIPGTEGGKQEYDLSES